jgi:GT2 family glycosyltransferase
MTLSAMPTRESSKDAALALNSSGRQWAHKVIFLLLSAPIDWLTLMALSCAEIVGRVFRKILPKTPPAFPPLRPECSFVIFSWNSQSMLEESLPPLLEAVRKEGGNHEIIVIDSHSTDGTDEFIRRRFPEIRLVPSEENTYFGAGNRLGIQAATRDVLVLMNSDTIVSPESLPPLIAAFRNPAVFGVASKVVQREPQQCRETGNTHAYFNGGQMIWRHDPIDGLENDSYYPIFWLHRGLFAVDRRKYTWLGGFDRVYDPLYMEDIDLSYRAWKAGWECVLAGGSEVAHLHLLGSPTSGEAFLRTIVRRNQYIFFWKNINDLPRTLQYLWRSTWTRISCASRLDGALTQEIRSLLGALKRLPLILLRRVATSRAAVRSDQDVFKLTAGQEPSPQEKI